MSDFSAFQIWIGLWIAVAIFIAPIAILSRAPYGRHVRHGWGRLIDNQLGWFFMELPTLIICPLIYVMGSLENSWVNHCIILLFLIHYANRVLIFPFRLRTAGKQIPIFIVLSACLFNLINGFNIAYEFGFIRNYQSSWFSSWQFILGTSLFLIGMLINWKSDTLLIKLRKPGETGYKIPQGFLFKYISCPNHFGEILEWIGFALLTWSISGLAFCIWTASNLIPRSLNHHQWYKDHFEEYPKDRKAVIPKLL